MNKGGVGRKIMIVTAALYRKCKKALHDHRLFGRSGAVVYGRTLLEPKSVRAIVEEWEKFQVRIAERLGHDNFEILSFTVYSSRQGKAKYRLFDGTEINTAQEEAAITGGNAK